MSAASASKGEAVPLTEAPAVISVRRRRRAAWLAVTVGCLAWTVAEFISDHYAYGARLSQFPSLAGAALLLWTFGACVGLLLYPSGRSKQSGICQLIDYFSVLTLLFLVAWLAFWRPLFTAADGGSGLVISLAYLTGDVGILTAAAVVLVRAGAELRSPLALLVLGVVCVTTSGGLIGLGWLLGLLFIAVAAGMDFLQPASRDWAPARPLRSWVSMAVPYAPVLFACGVAAFASDGDDADIPARVAALALIGAALVRRFVAVRDGMQPLILNPTQVLQDSWSEQTQPRVR